MLLRYIGGNPIELDVVAADGTVARLEVVTGGEVEFDDERAAVFIEAADMWVSVTGEVPAPAKKKPVAPAGKTG